MLTKEHYLQNARSGGKIIFKMVVYPVLECKHVYLRCAVVSTR